MLNISRSPQAPEQLLQLLPAKLECSLGLLPAREGVFHRWRFAFLAGTLSLSVPAVAMFDLEVTALGLHFGERAVGMLGTREGGGLDVVEVVDLVELIIEDVVQLRVLQDVPALVLQPLLPPQRLLRRPLPLLMQVFPRPVLVLVVSLCNGRGDRLRLLSLAREAAGWRFFEGCEFADLLLEGAVVLLEFAQLAAEGVFLLRGSLVDPLHEELVVQPQSRVRHRQSLRKHSATCGTSNKSLYLLKNSIDYSPSSPCRVGRVVDASLQSKVRQMRPIEAIQYMFYNQEEEEGRPQCSSAFITVDLPGRRTELTQATVKQLQRMLFDGKRRLPFFGGHPASITKQSCNDIFKTLNSNRQSPYLLCEKTDGVRYLLIVAKVTYAQLSREVMPGEEAPYTEFYLVSRQGTGKLVAYAAEIGLSHLLEAASTEVGPEGQAVVEVLDGELIRESSGQIRYLVFDALVHLGRNICGLKLSERLECAANFLRCSEMLGVGVHRIEVRVKDFFRLTCGKFNMVEFLLKKYVKCLPHENDGIIFNHEEKPYLLATTNNGYIKWKPAHLNTVDFMIVPNLALEETVGKRVLDLYLALHDPKLELYTRQFYAFAVVTEADFNKLLETYNENEARVAEEEAEELRNEKDAFAGNHFAGAIIAECRYEVTKADERKVMQKLYAMDADELCRSIMKQGDDGKDRKAISDMKNQIYDQGWKIYKLRPDKSLPNNTEVARRIEESIRDGITEHELIKKNEELNRLAFGNQ